MHKFKVGQRVEVTDVNASFYGLTGTISSEMYNCVYLVEFDDGGSRWLLDHRLSLIDDRIECITTYRVGDMEFDSPDKAKDHISRKKLNKMLGSVVSNLVIKNKKEVIDLLFDIME